MYLRTRNRSFSSPEGTKVFKSYYSNGTPQPGGTTQYGSYVSMWTEMQDVVGNPKGVNACFQTKRGKSGGIMNGYSIKSGRYHLIYSGWPFDRTQSIGPLEHLVIPNVPSDNWAAAEVQGMTNPSEPDVSIPVAIGELKDLPKMFEKKVKQSKGSSVVEHNFGYAPIIEDVIKLFNVMELVEQRLKTLKLLGRGKPISRKRTVFSSTVFEEDTTRKIADYHPRGAMWSHSDHKSTRLQKQATIRWAPSFNIGELDPNELRKLALRQVLGLDPQHLASSIYELIPWSWLFDYFSNLGDLVSTTQNSVASPSGLAAVSTVTETTLKISNFEFSESGVTCTPFRMTRRDWQRMPVFPVLEFRMPILTSGQVTTLAGLINQWG